MKKLLFCFITLFLAITVMFAYFSSVYAEETYVIHIDVSDVLIRLGGSRTTLHHDSYDAGWYCYGDTYFVPYPHSQYNCELTETPAGCFGSTNGRL